MILFLVFFAVVMLFGFVLLFGAPYLPTKKRQTETVLELMKLKKGATIYELGCGDGRVLRHFASQGYKAVGYELNPLLVIVAKMVTWKYRKNVRIVWGNFWRADLTTADGVYIFLLDNFMQRFDQKMIQRTGKPIPVVSYAFTIPDKKIITEKNGLYLYKY